MTSNSAGGVLGDGPSLRNNGNSAASCRETKTGDPKQPCPEPGIGTAGKDIDPSIVAKARAGNARMPNAKQAVVEEQIQAARLLPPPEVLSIAALGGREIDPAATLLGNRWLCRGQACVIVGPSGIGKSSMAMQQDLCWSIGREAFGIEPNGPLRILTVQAENDEGDLIEMLRGVKAGLGFSAEDEKLHGANVFYVLEQMRTGAAFVEAVLRPLLEEYKPDILRVDPLQAFAGCDLTSASDVAELLRHRANPLLRQYNCGLILMHHTPKPGPSKDKSKQRTSDWMYSGAGSHDIVNWARAVMTIDPAQRDGVYRLIAAKRGGRIGWKNAESGEKETSRWFKWAAGGICWERAEAAEAESSNEPGVKELLQFIPFEPGIEKKILKDNANSLGKIPLNKFSVLIERALEEGLIEQREEKRKNARPRVVIVRTSKAQGITNCVTTKGNLGGTKISFLPDNGASQRQRKRKSGKRKADAPASEPPAPGLWEQLSSMDASGDAGVRAALEMELAKCS